MSSTALQTNLWISSTQIPLRRMEPFATAALTRLPQDFLQAMEFGFFAGKLQIRFRFPANFLSINIEDPKIDAHALRLAILAHSVGLAVETALKQLQPQMLWKQIASNLNKEYQNFDQLQIAKTLLTCADPFQHHDVYAELLPEIDLPSDFFRELGLSRYDCDFADLKEDLSMEAFWIDLFYRCLQKNPSLALPEHWISERFAAIVLKMDTDHREKFESIFQQCFPAAFQEAPLNCILIYLQLFSDDHPVFQIPALELPEIAAQEFFQLFEILHIYLDNEGLHAREQLGAEPSNFPWRELLRFLLEFSSRYPYYNPHPVKLCLDKIPRNTWNSTRITLRSASWDGIPSPSIHQTLLAKMNEESVLNSISVLLKPYQDNPIDLDYCPRGISYFLETLASVKRKLPVPFVITLLKSLHHQPHICTAIHNTVVQSLSPEEIAAIDEALRMDPPLLPDPPPPPAEGEEPPPKRPRTK